MGESCNAWEKLDNMNVDIDLYEDSNALKPQGEVSTTGNKQTNQEIKPQETDTNTKEYCININTNKNGEDEEMKLLKCKIKYEQKPMGIKFRLVNNTDNYYNVSIKFMDKTEEDQNAIFSMEYNNLMEHMKIQKDAQVWEDSNLHTFRNSVNYHVKQNCESDSFLFLQKKDPSKKMGQ